MIKNKCVVFTGGGTGGHIYPGLAVADELARLYLERNNSGISIVWIGSSSGMDKEIIKKSGKTISFIGIPSGKLRRYFSFKNIIDLFKIAAGCISAFFILLHLKPLIVFSKGGFVSVPPCFAAKILHIPVYTHECDYSPGLATRLNSKFAEKILLSFSDTAKFFPESRQSHIAVTGNPVRPAFYSSDYKNGLKFLGLFNDSNEVNASNKPHKNILLVLGGSSGAKQINSIVQTNIDWLCKNFIVVHQTGKGNMSSVSINDYKQYEFIYEEMPDVIAAADIVLTRAGSNSLWECAALGKPLVLIPLAGAGTRGDQVENAKFFAENNAAISLDGDEVEKDGNCLCDALKKLSDSDIRKQFSENILKLAGNKRPALAIANILISRL